MSGETIITLVGNATQPELRYTPSGKPVANFRVASTPRTFDRQKNEWVDGETLWVSCGLWGEAAEHFVESFGDAKSLRVIVSGRLKSRSFETREGDRRTVFEVDVDEVGPSLRYATAKVQRVQGGGAGSSSGWSQPAATSQADPWDSPAASNDQPPF